jgi:hypothetical protein
MPENHVNDGIIIPPHLVDKVPYFSFISFLYSPFPPSPHLTLPLLLILPLRILPLLISPLLILPLLISLLLILPVLISPLLILPHLILPHLISPLLILPHLILPLPYRLNDPKEINRHRRWEQPANIPYTASELSFRRGWNDTKHCK